MGACQACGFGGVDAPSTVKVAWISKQYRVLGWSGISLLARNWDGECAGVPHVCSGPYWLFGGVRVWPSVWVVGPDF